jgi:hypothetical protein
VRITGKKVILLDGISETAFEEKRIVHFVTTTLIIHVADIIKQNLQTQGPWIVID